METREIDPKKIHEILSEKLWINFLMYQFSPKKCGFIYLLEL